MADIPKYIGKYKIDVLIAKGGMGEVYKGIHPTLNKNVILKKLTLDNHEQFIERFNREARIMMEFRNDNIVDVYDHFKEGDNYYIVLEYIDGISLDQFIQKERYLSSDLALYITGEISKALVYAHNKNVIHRDIKPGNILLSKTGEVKLVDFGIAVSDKESGQDLTKEGMTLGTPSYMAPEQFSNSKNVDKRADIYSVGVMLYEMVTGKKPYSSGLSAQSIAMIQKGRHRSPRKVNPETSIFAAKLIKKLMKPKIRKRVQDMEVVNKLLTRYFKATDVKCFANRISDMINENPLREIKIKKHNKLFPIVILVIIMCSSIMYGYKEGYFFEYFKSNDYGLVKIELSVDDGYYKNISELSIISKLYNEELSKLEFLENTKLNFVSSKNEKNRKSCKTYLPNGNYRLKVNIDGNIFWSNFTVLSRKTQKLNTLTSEGVNVQIKFVKPEKQRLKTHFSIYDIETGENLSESTTINIKDNNKYIPYSSIDTELETDNVYFFKFSKEGYYDKEYILRIESDQTDLIITAALFPISGKISVISNVDNVDLKINNRNTIETGYPLRTIKKIDPIGVNQTDIIINPGNYSMSFKYKGQKVVKDFIVSSEEDYLIELVYMKNEKKLLIKE